MGEIDGRPCRLTVCRGCCCGTRKKVPGVDHRAQLARLSAIDDHAGRTVPVRTSKCLGICFQADVVVVQPSQAGHAAGGRPVWLGKMTEDALLDALDDWIFDGGPGLAPVPAVLADHVTSKDAKKPKKPKKRKRREKSKKAEKAEKAEKAGKKRRKAKGGGDGKASRPAARDDGEKRRKKKDKGGKKGGDRKKK